MAENMQVRLVECPRDAMQGWPQFIPTGKKIEYLNSLLRVGFDTLDFGSFVSPKAIPQMADTREVLAGLDTSQSPTRLLAIVANPRGAEEAAAFEQISYLGFPFSVSETFQLRNTNASMGEALRRVEEIQQLCQRKQKSLVIYLSMGFGNPYGDPYSEEIVFEWVNRLIGLDVQMISLADTVGLATPEQVYGMTEYLVDSLPGIEIGVHLHSRPDNWKEKLDAALRAGCRRFDGALRGVGGCPFAGDELVGNMNTEAMIIYFREKGLLPSINEAALEQSLLLAAEIFR
ncbi:MAG TPA: hydroxymethylglutaryl-CoA lyase [Chitinophagaceae bacterium]|nr:hydroxymethylglutaryl-CoA lyase [Chitinophagaceae bacterium]